VRRIDPWSVLRVSVLLYVALYCVVIVAGVILWTAFTATGLRGNIEGFIAGIIESGQFKFVAEELLRASVVIGAILVVMGTAANTFFAVVYNLISDLVGGVTMVVEDRPSRRAARAEARRAAAAAAAPAAPAAEGPPEPEQRTPLVPAPTSATPAGARTQPVAISPAAALGAGTAPVSPDRWTTPAGGEPVPAPPPPVAHPTTVSEATAKTVPGSTTTFVPDSHENVLLRRRPTPDAVVPGPNSDNGPEPPIGTDNGPVDTATEPTDPTDDDHKRSRPDPNPDPGARPAPAGLGGPPD